MWDFLNQMTPGFGAASPSFARYQTLLGQLFNLSEEDAVARLASEVREMNERAFAEFMATLALTRQQIEKGLEAVRSRAAFESGGPGRPDEEQQLGAVIQGIDAIGGYAQHFFARRETPAPSAPETEPASGVVDALIARLRRMVETGAADPALLQDLMAFAHSPEDMEKIGRVLEELGGADAPGATMTIEDYYRPGDEMPFELLWPLRQGLPVPFGQLDHKTQFFVLFNEWTRREFEGNVALKAGDTVEAQSIFEECLERARQLAVAELAARSYEGMMRTAQRLGDRELERSWLAAAVAERGQA